MTTTIGIPDVFREDDRLAGRLKVGLSEALARRFTESDWKKFAALHGLSERLSSHPRFYRSLRFDDPDHEGMVLDLVTLLFDDDEEAFAALIANEAVRSRMRTSGYEDILAAWDCETDPLVTALAHAMVEVQDANEVVDLSVYVGRIQAALPADPHAALGATKDMLEATMRTVLRLRAEQDIEKLDFPALIGRCFSVLDLVPNSPPQSPEDRSARQIASQVRKTIGLANELRNLAGTGHGRVVGEEVPVSAIDANFVASSGLVAAAWLLRRQAERS